MAKRQKEPDWKDEDWDECANCENIRHAHPNNGPCNGGGGKPCPQNCQGFVLKEEAPPAAPVATQGQGAEVAVRCPHCAKPLWIVVKG